MKRVFYFILICILFVESPCYGGLFDDILGDLGLSSREDLDSSTIVSGLKEALSVGTGKAVDSVSQVDGYFSNQVIRILMPEKIQKVAEVLGKLGYQDKVDAFILSMNRAAERAAPQASTFFVGAIKEMTFEDAKKILDGGDTAATLYFKEKTYQRLYESFEPVISSTMNEAGVTRSYKDMMGKYTSLPFMKAEFLDLDRYVTGKALDGLFYMVGEEEKKIRTDPASRVTEILKKVFTR